MSHPFDTEGSLTQPTIGLTAAEAQSRLRSYGPNQLPPPPRRSIWARIWGQVRDPMILLLIAAGTMTGALGDVPDTIIIATVVVFNTVIGVVQELRAEQAITALHALTAPVATVVRDGEVQEIPANKVVPGEILRLTAGDQVPADAEVLSADRLQLDQSAMTGESLPIDVTQNDEVTAGTLVTRGRATTRVTRTGLSSGLGQIALLIATSPQPPTPLQRRLTQLSRLLVWIVLILTAAVLVFGFAEGKSLVDLAILGVSLAVAAVPESLPAVVAIALALGAHRMARRAAVVRSLPAVETLGSVSVYCHR
jgi:P-type Ca2+ transporter type 2C